MRALLACPTGSIGTLGPNDAKQVVGDFPLLVEEPVYYCGFASAKSYGGSSYFVRDAVQGNWLIDSPKFLPQLVRRFEAWGGISSIFLTHEDDVADAARYAKHFGSRRIIGNAELASQPDAEMVLDGRQAIELAPGRLAIPTPGHTAGHIALLVDNRFLFTGDHLWWSRRRQRLEASRHYCWHDWSQQTDSMVRLLDYQFEWILPGHGQRIQLSPERIQDELRALIDRMRRP